MFSKDTKLKPIFVLLLLFGIITSSAIFLTGCDGFVGVAGFAYEWVDAPPSATSQLYITNVEFSKDVEPTLKKALDNIPAEISKVPLENVIIDAELIQATSNSTGEFNKYSLVAPGWYPIRVKAMKEGYQEVFKDIKHDTFYHVIIAILVKKT